MDLDFEEVIQQDARDTKQVLQENSVDLAITSPPYFDLKDYDTDEQIGYGQAEEEYLDDIKQVFEGVYKALDDSGSFWVIVDTYKREGDIELLQFEMAKIAKNIGEKEGEGFQLKEIITWDKNHTLPWTKDYEMRNVFEYILVFSKSEEPKFEKDRIKEVGTVKDYWINFPERYNPEGKTPRNIWEHTIPSQGAWSDDSIQHACPFPPKLVERIIRLTTDEGDVVFDPFAGTGTVVAQAEVMGREGIGFELNQDYIDNYYEKVKPKIEDEYDPETDRSEHEIFKQNIYDLRRLKHPKKVIRELLNDDSNDWTEEKLSLNTIIAYPQPGKPDEKHKMMKQDMVVVHENGIDEAKLEKDIEEVASTPKSSKFGIKPEVKVVERKEVNGNFDEYFSEKLNLYTKGNFKDKVDELEKEEWLERCHGGNWKNLGKNGVPPILSTIEMDEDGLMALHNRLSDDPEKRELREEKNNLRDRVKQLEEENENLKENGSESY
jgi:DNA modification methylase